MLAVDENLNTDGILTVSMVKNQTIKADAGKPRLSLVPVEIIRCIARVREFGNRKYKDSNSWKQVEPGGGIVMHFSGILSHT